MKIHRLNTILNKCGGKKFKKDYIKYLRSLDFDEFEILFNFYNSAITRLRYRYINKHEKVKFLSKEWVRDEELKNKFLNLNLLFRTANIIYVEKANNNIVEDNKKKLELINKITEITKSLEVIKNAKLVMSEKPDQKDMLNLIAILVEYIYNKNESQKILDELNNLKK